MDWLDGVRIKLKRKNLVLFSKDSDLLAGLRLLIQGQNRRTLVLWALDFASQGAAQLEGKNPAEKRPQEAVAAAWAWAEGRCTMQRAQRAILDCHAAARDTSSLEDIALCHAVGQACSVVHTTGHALGYPIYDLTAIVRRLGADNCRAAVESRVREYEGKLLEWVPRGDEGRAWAAFLLR